MKLKAIRVRTKYWRPGTDHVKEIIQAVGDRVEDGDIVSVSEKAIATARGLLLDEAGIKPGKLAQFLAGTWTRRFWGGPLGRLTGLRGRTIERLRSFPIKEGSAHKQCALQHVGLLQALRHYSEGGIDASNLPYALVSLPLDEPGVEAARIRRALEAETGRRLSVMIVDGDATYSWRNLHLAPRRVKIPGLVHAGGFLAFVFGRVLGLKPRPTPVALSGEPLNPDRTLWLAKVAHRVSGPGAGRTVWGMSERLGTGLTGVTWEMLEAFEHAPIVILRVLEG